jgi:large subunit ribosomal protein L35
MLKTKKAVADRFRINKNGRIKRSRAGKRHLLTTKSRGRKRHLRESALVGPADVRRIRRFLPYG